MAYRNRRWRRRASISTKVRRPTTPTEPDPDDQPAGSRPLHALSEVPPWRQRKYQIAAAAGAAALVSVGAVVALGSGGDGGRNPTAMPAGGSTATTGTPSTPGNSAVPAPKAASGSPSVAPSRTVSDQIRVSNSGTIKNDRRTLRVVSAYGDLTGKRELAWVADAGHVVGAARCTQNFKFNAEARAGVRPTMLLCWRTSATKSVYTVAVNLSQRPSEKDSVATIDKVWRQMG